MILILFLFALPLSPSCALNIRAPDPRERIISNVAGEDKLVLTNSAPWASLTRGQFMRDIMFGIHPESPRNREAWIKSGLLRPRTPQLRIMPLPFGSTQVQMPYSKQEIKAKRPLRRKLIYSKRLPKLTDILEDSVNSNISDTKVALNNKQETHLKSPLELPAEVLVASADSDKAPRCFIQKTLPVLYYYFPVSVAPISIPYFKNNAGYQRPNPSLFETGQYVPIQNRLPYPPRVVYLSQLPPDLIAMEGSKDEQELLTPTATKTIVSDSKPALQSAPQKIVQLENPAITTNKARVPELPQIIDVEFRGDDLPLNVISKDPDDKAVIISDNNKETAVKADNITEEDAPVLIEQQNIQEEISFRDETSESSTSAVQETVTQVVETD